MAKTDALTLEDEESGLVPFILAAEKCNNDDTSGSLNMAFELLCLQPHVLEYYDKSNMANKRSSGAKSHLNITERSKEVRRDAEEIEL